MASENGSRAVPTTDAAGDGTDFNKEVCQYLKDHNVSADVVKSISGTHISPEDLAVISETKLSSIGIDDPIDKKIVRVLLNAFVQPVPTKPTMKYKIFNDPIHGHIELNDLLVSIIDTPEFQRLRWIKQLGTCHLVYPGAIHTRFEHSLGVAHLAGKFVKTLRQNQPEITDVDVLCVEIAGLCHDLGHGPFSHLFEKFKRTCDRLQSKRTGYVESFWKHEDASLDMFDHLVERNGLKVKFSQYGIHERDILFIKELINGTVKPNKACHGRPRKQNFLYEIVSNKETGVDVDKWDYFARDRLHLNKENKFDHERFMHFCCVIGSHICCRDKEAYNLLKMFMLRADLHRTAYQHKTTQNIENMLVDALVKANRYKWFEGANDTWYRMSHCMEDMEAYSKLTDYIFFDILLSSGDKLAPARKVLLRIQQRKLYRFVGETMPTKDHVNNDDWAAISSDAIADRCNIINRVDPRVDFKDELVGQIVTLDFGKGDKNPLKNIRIFSKKKPDTSLPMDMRDVSMTLPQSFKEVKFRLYCRSEDTSVYDVAKLGFEKWCIDNGYPKPFVDMDA